MSPPLERRETRHMIAPGDLPPTRADFEVIGAFNPAAIALDDGSTLLLVRVAERPIQRRDGHIASPRYTAQGNQVIDWIDQSLVSSHDPRVMRFKHTGFKRLTFTSHLRVVRSSDGMSISDIGPAIVPAAEHESFGLEDPRIVKISAEYLITAVGASFHGVVTQLLSTRDLERFDRGPIIFCRENKDVLLFPETIGGQYAAIHRPTGKFECMQPEMWISFSPDLVHWGRHQPLWGSARPSEKPGHDPAVARSWDDGRVGGGVPPIRTEQGWLMIYHASCRPLPGEPIGVYAAGALLLDLEDPTKVIGRTPDAFMRPEADFETAGFVKAVVFPTGHAMRGRDILLYYGAADTSVGVVRYRFQDLMDRLEPL